MGLELSRVHKASRVRTTCLLPSFIRTPLFNGEVNQMGFFLPLLHVDTVADRVVAHIISGRSGGKIYIPKFVALLGCVVSTPFSGRRARALTERVTEVFPALAGVDFEPGCDQE